MRSPTDPLATVTPSALRKCGYIATRCGLRVSGVAPPPHVQATMAPITTVLAALAAAVAAAIGAADAAEHELKVKRM